MCGKGPTLQLPRALPTELVSLSAAVLTRKAGWPGTRLLLHKGVKWARGDAYVAMALHPGLWWPPGVRAGWPEDHGEEAETRRWGQERKRRRGRRRSRRPAGQGSGKREEGRKRRSQRRGRKKRINKRRRIRTAPAVLCWPVRSMARSGKWLDRASVVVCEIMPVASGICFDSSVKCCAFCTCGVSGREGPRPSPCLGGSVGWNASTSPWVRVLGHCVVLIRMCGRC